MKQLTPTDLLECLKWRYASKVFDAEKTIPSALWSAVEDSLILTPSSFGLQPWHFEVITDSDLKKQLLPHSWNQPQTTDCSHLVVFTARTSPGQEEVDHFLNKIAETRGVELSSLAGYGGMMSGFLEKMDEAELFAWAKNQTYIALGQLMSVAAVLGIDACPMEGINPVDYDRILGLSKRGFSTTVACAMGYRSLNDQYAELEKVRFEKEDLITRRG